MALTNIVKGVVRGSFNSFASVVVSNANKKKVVGQ